MADPVWPTAPWYLLAFDWQEPKPGFIIEHSHRAAMYLVGFCTIVLAAGLWRVEPRRWVCWLGVAALAGVVLQGLLGGFRVLLDRRLGTDLAFVHGCMAQLVAATLVSIACVTAPGWSPLLPSLGDSGALRRFRYAALTIAVLVYLQVIFGALLRHTYSSVGPRGHFLTAFAVTAVAVWLVKETWDHHRQERRVRAVAMLLAAFVAVQLCIGVETWLLRFEAASPATQVWLKTTHVMVGYLIFATAVVTALHAFRPGAVRAVAGTFPVRQLEGAA